MGTRIEFSLQQGPFDGDEIELTLQTVPPGLALRTAAARYAKYEFLERHESGRYVYVFHGYANRKASPWSG